MCSLWSHLPTIDKDSGTEWALFVVLPVVWIVLVIVGTVFSKSRLGQLSIVKSYQVRQFEFGLGYGSRGTVEQLYC